MNTLGIAFFLGLCATAWGLFESPMPNYVAILLGSIVTFLIMLVSETIKGIKVTVKERNERPALLAFWQEHGLPPKH